MSGVVYFLAKPIDAPSGILKLLGVVILGGLIYGGLLLVSRVISKQELKDLFHKS